MDWARKYAVTSDLLGGVGSHVCRLPSSWAHWKGCKARNGKATTGGFPYLIDLCSFWMDDSRMGRGPKRLLRVSSAKLARSPIRTLESHFLSRCWGWPIVISLHSSRARRQMGVDIRAELNCMISTVTHNARVFLVVQSSWLMQVIPFYLLSRFILDFLSFFPCLISPA